MVVGGAIEGRGDNLALDRALHVGDFLGALVHEHHHEVNLGVVLRDRISNLLEDDGLTGFRRCHDEATLALANGGNEVDDPRREIRGLVLEAKARIGVQRRELVELDAGLCLLGRHAVDGVDAHERRKLRVAVIVAPAPAASTTVVEILLALLLLAVLRRLDLADDRIALAQAVLAHLVHRHVDVARAGQVAGRAHKRVVVTNIENARDLDEDVVFAHLRLAVIVVIATVAVAVAVSSARAAATAIVVVVVVVVAGAVVAAIAAIFGIAIFLFGVVIALPTIVAAVAALFARVLAALARGLRIGKFDVFNAAGAFTAAAVAALAALIVVVLLGRAVFTVRSATLARFLLRGLAGARGLLCLLSARVALGVCGGSFGRACVLGDARFGGTCGGGRRRLARTDGFDQLAFAELAHAADTHGSRDGLKLREPLCRKFGGVSVVVVHPGSFLRCVSRGCTQFREMTVLFRGKTRTRALGREARVLHAEIGAPVGVRNARPS